MKLKLLIFAMCPMVATVYAQPVGSSGGASAPGIRAEIIHPEGPSIPRAPMPRLTPQMNVGVSMPSGPQSAASTTGGNGGDGGKTAGTRGAGGAGGLLIGNGGEGGNGLSDAVPKPALSAPATNVPIKTNEVVR